MSNKSLKNLIASLAIVMLAFVACPDTGKKGKEGGVDNQTVYVAGNDSMIRAVIWKNGIANRIHNTESLAYSVFVSGGTEYVVGWDYDSTIWNERATQWKNGTRSRLGQDGSNAMSVFVK